MMMSQIYRLVARLICVILSDLCWRLKNRFKLNWVGLKKKPDV
ncbi:hypothetical protein Hanom_Chr12g01125501 [Helianthus anomalus]